MVSIIHRIGIKSAAPDTVYQALSTSAGLAGWWTHDTQGATEPGGELRFRFDDNGFDMRINELDPGKRVAWRVERGDSQWIGTTIGFDLKPARDAEGNDYTAVLFSHDGWAEPTEVMHHCSTRWATYLLSLKSLVETGAGEPYPHDVPIGD